MHLRVSKTNYGEYFYLAHSVWDPVDRYSRGRILLSLGKNIDRAYAQQLVNEIKSVFPYEVPYGYGQVYSDFLWEYLQPHQGTVLAGVRQGLPPQKIIQQFKQKTKPPWRIT